MENKEIADKFLQLVNAKYGDFKKKWAKHAIEKGIEFDEDVYSDSIVKVYDYILKNGVKDTSDEGLSNYLFRSFITNSKREKVYAREKLKDMNVDAWEEGDKDENGETELQHRIRNEIYGDYAMYYILRLVEENFDSITFHCFRLYYIVNKMTYERLREITKIKDAKKRVLQVRTWLQENLTKKQLIKEFNKYYYD